MDANCQNVITNKEAIARRWCVKRSSEEFHNMRMRTPVVEYRFNISIGQQPITIFRKSLRNLWFPVNFADIIQALRTPMDDYFNNWHGQPMTCCLSSFVECIIFILCDLERPARNFSKKT